MSTPRQELQFELEKDVYWAEVNVSWYRHELKAQKYCDKDEAQEHLDIWQERLESKKNQLKRLKEMIEIYGK